MRRIKPHNVWFTFVGPEIAKLVEFLGDIKIMPLTRDGSFRITDEQLKRLELSAEQIPIDLDHRSYLPAQVTSNIIDERCQNPAKKLKL
jgi:hypothetical protein